MYSEMNVPSPEVRQISESYINTRTHVLVRVDKCTVYF